ncbi:MAG: hypothetical protein KA137_04120, partial [Halioglobus sp.]|nr:hypothetical protein [Halioglobus sp.]
EYYVHEARFSSIRGPDRLLDYDVGYYYQEFDGVSLFNLPVYPGGAFGPPGSAVPGAITDPYSRYTLPVDGRYTISRTLESFYGNLQFHLPYETELTLGLRSIDDQSSAPAITEVGSAYNAIKNPVAAIYECSQLGNLSPAAKGAVDSPIYGDGYCDIPVAATSTTEGGDDDHDDTIYNISLSHRFSDDVLAYVTTGTSYRSGLPSLNNPGLPEEYLFPEPETATSYEIGVKSNWSDWLVVNAALFLIDYQDQLTQFQSIPYYNSISGRVTNTSVAFFQNVDAQVTGGELEITAAPMENLTLTTNLSYSEIESEGGEVPCIDASRPINADNIINTCESEQGSNLNASPKFQASFVGNYVLPLGAFDGYLRTLVNYQDENPNFGASLEEADAYTTVDLFAGLTGNEGGWDVGLYAKNVFNTRNQLFRQNEPNSIYPEFGDNGYDTVNMNLPREVGMSVLYAFGSR